jgi:hypothetical protein
VLLQASNDAYWRFREGLSGRHSKRPTGEHRLRVRPANIFSSSCRWSAEDEQIRRIYPSDATQKVQVIFKRDVVCGSAQGFVFPVAPGSQLRLEARDQRRCASQSSVH